VLRFSLKRILVSMAFIAAGLPLVVNACRAPVNDESEIGYFLLTSTIGFALVGCGALIPFKHPLLGAALGLLVMFLLFFQT
jgi:hypothetical protein